MVRVMSYTDIIYNSVKKYEGQKTYRINIGELTRIFPLINVGDKLWIASNASVVLGDIEFADKISDIMARKVQRIKDIEGILTAEAKAIGISYFFGYKLGLDKITIARKSLKSYMRNPIIVKTHSITTREEQKLILDSEDVNTLKNKRIIIFDDVISTGNTIRSLIELATKSGAEIAGIVTIWLEGPWSWELFEKEIKEGKMLFVSYLPVFVESNEYQCLLEKVNAIAGRYK